MLLHTLHGGRAVRRVMSWPPAPGDVNPPVFHWVDWLNRLLTEMNEWFPNCNPAQYYHYSHLHFNTFIHLFLATTSMEAEGPIGFLANIQINDVSHKVWTIQKMCSDKHSSSHFNWLCQMAAHTQVCKFRNTKHLNLCFLSPPICQFNLQHNALKSCKDV